MSKTITSHYNIRRVGKTILCQKNYSAGSDSSTKSHFSWKPKPVGDVNDEIYVIKRFRCHCANRIKINKVKVSPFYIKGQNLSLFPKFHMGLKPILSHSLVFMWLRFNLHIQIGMFICIGIIQIMMPNNSIRKTYAH